MAHTSKAIIKSQGRLAPAGTSSSGYPRGGRIPLGVWLLFVFVILPLLVSTTYFGAIASNRYVSESQFIVRSLSSKRISGLDAILKTFGLATTQDDAYAISNYINSRDIVKALNSKIDLHLIFSRPGTDLIARFPEPWSKDSFESLYNYFLERVSAVRDANTGITTLRVTTFRPEDSVALSKAIMELSEQLANSMNERAQSDAVRSAEADVKRAQAEMLTAQAKIRDYRNNSLLLDPNQSSQDVMRIIGQMSADLATNLADISETSSNSPSNPAIASMKARSTAIQEQLVAERQKLAGSDKALAKKISEFENLTMEREFAERRLTAALGSMESARQDARRQQVYLEQIVEPNEADESTDPRRFHAILTTGFFAFVMFGLAWVLFAGIKEHSNG